MNRTSQLIAGIRAEWNGPCELDYHEELPSTNQFLSAQLDASTELPRACVARLQTAGVGRRGKSWLSAPDSITFSVAHSFELPAQRLMGLSLVTGLAVVQVLNQLYDSSFRLKWPNDVLLVNDADPVRASKLAGILIELKVSGTSASPETVAIAGVGLNVASGEELNQVDQPYATLDDAVPVSVERPGVDVLSGRLIGAMVREFTRFSTRGWNDFAQNWAESDFLYGRDVAVSGGTGPAYGVARGVNEDGALMIETDGRLSPVYSGEVSVRAV